MLSVVTDNGSTQSGSLIDEIVREGARRMLAAALEAEVNQYIAELAAETDEAGRRLVVRNGCRLGHPGQLRVAQTPSAGPWGQAVGRPRVLGCTGGVARVRVEGVVPVAVDAVPVHGHARAQLPRKGDECVPVVQAVAGARRMAWGVTLNRKAG